jgi:argininosuccinate lyase
MPFRTAYYITKDVVTKANELNKDISELNIQEIRSANDELKDVSEEIVMYLDLRNSMNARNSFGGTSSIQTENQIKYFEEWLNSK